MALSWRKLIPVLAFPMMLTAGILLIPVVPDYSDHALAAAAVQQTGRWAVGHLTAAAAFGLGVWAAGTIVGELERRAQRPPFLLPLMAIGGGLYAAGMGADGIGPVAVRASAASPALFFDGSGWWVTGVFLAGTLFFGVGLIFMTGQCIQAGLVSGRWRTVTFVSALVFVAAPAIPSGWALYGVALASLGVFAPLGVSIARST